MVAAVIVYCMLTVYNFSYQTYCLTRAVNSLSPSLCLFSSLILL